MSAAVANSEPQHKTMAALAQAAASGGIALLPEYTLSVELSGHAKGVCIFTSPLLLVVVTWSIGARSSQEDSIV